MSGSAPLAYLWLLAMWFGIVDREGRQQQNCCFMRQRRWADLDLICDCKEYRTIWTDQFHIMLFIYALMTIYAALTILTVIWRAFLTDLMRGRCEATCQPRQDPISRKMMPVWSQFCIAWALHQNPLCDFCSRYASVMVILHIISKFLQPAYLVWA